MPDASGLVTIDDVRAAAGRLDGVAVRTPLVPAAWAGGELWLKPEGLQTTGAFKLRGAFNAVALLDDDERARGVVTHSSGNHAQALAWAAAAQGIPATVVMPDAAAPLKVAATRALGADVIMVPSAERDSRVEQLRTERGLTFISPFDHPGVIAGGGTVGLEIAADLPDVDTVLVPVGGGGLISGIAVAMAAAAPSARVVAVEPELAADLAESLARGERVRWDPERTYRTIADGVRLPVVGELTWRHIQAHVDEVVTVPEDAILAAMAAIATRGRIVAEPTGALTTAAFLTDPGRFGRSVAVVSGGNADPTLLAKVLMDAAGWTPRPASR
ncbi:threonine ammonia-lyase [Jiangella asiatica]|uniref:threonine ammonia-lyase n=1 Tax=Jiangella asiatica TaxID=2530372 RepID=A0A4R5DG57_9ACTN|nr:threonine/serine dehydratase [Jiangella asiatica]TDE10891.1 pyridoxal-phosphate dependent enzyme [Jiangella asiatica]